MSLRKLTQEQRRMHTAFGLHSNIPACCVEYYIDQWVPNNHLTHDGSPHALKIKQLELEMGDEGPRYIPCPDCLRLRSFNKAHMCQDCPEQKQFYAERDRIGGGWPK